MLSGAGLYFGLGAWGGAFLGSRTASLNQVPLVSADGVVIVVWMSVLFGGLGLICGMLARGAAFLLIRNSRVPAALPAQLGVGLLWSGACLLALRSSAQGETSLGHVGIAVLCGAALGTLTVRLLPSRRGVRLVLGMAGWAAAAALGAASEAVGPAERPRERAGLVGDVEPSPARPLLLVGFDSMDPRWLAASMRRGAMPNFERLAARGFLTELKTLPYAISPAVWTTIATGRLPREHGVRWFSSNALAGTNVAVQLWPRHVGFTALTVAMLRVGLIQSFPAGREDRRVEALWTISSRFDRRVAVINWWASHPGEPVLGSVVTDRFLQARGTRPSIGATYPSTLAEELEPLLVRPSELSPSDLQPFVEQPLARDLEVSGAFFGDPLGYLGAAIAFDRSTMAAAREVARRGDYDLFAVYLRGLDLVGHGYAKHSSLLAELDSRAPTGSPYSEAFERYYRVVDRQLGALLETVGDAHNVLVVSDHGLTREPSGKYGHPDTGPAGVLLGAGPDVLPGVVVSGAHVLDLAPTVLHLLGLPASAEMPGRVLPLHGRLEPDDVARVPSYETGAPWRPGPARVPDPERERQLRALGYVQ